MGIQVILGGGGGEVQSIDVDRYFVRLQEKGLRMLYIPVAMDEGIYTYQECYSWIKSVFAPFGFEAIDMITDLKSISFDASERYCSVYIGGGNTFHLLNEIRVSGFDVKIRDFIKRGGCVYGGSAGAIILGKDIGTATYADSNDGMVKDLTGLDLLQSFSVWCHYQFSHDEHIESYIKNSGFSVLAIPEASGIAYDGKVFENIGSEDCYIFTKYGKENLQVGDKFKVTTSMYSSE